MRTKNILLLFYLCFAFQNIYAQVCGTPGKDGVLADRSSTINTYFSPASDMVLVTGSRQIMLNAVILNGGLFHDHYGSTPVSPGDLLILIQMQDAIINFSDDANMGQTILFQDQTSLAGLGIWI